MKSKARSLALLALGTLATAPTAVEAANFVWDGGSTTTNNWSADNNWTPNGAPDNNGTAGIFFDGTARLTPNVDVPWNVQSLHFNAGSGAFVIGGSQLTLGTGLSSVSSIVTSDASTQTINNDILMNANNTSWTAGSGPLVLGGTIDLNGFDLNIEGANPTTVSGAFVGAGTLEKYDTGTLTFSGATANTMSGLYNVVEGTLVLSKTVANGAVQGDLTIFNTATVRFDADNQILSASGNTVTVRDGGTLNLNGNSDTIFDLSFNNGGAVVAGSGGLLGVAGTITRSGSGGSVATVTGNLQLNGGTRTISITDALVGDELRINGIISNGGINFTGAGDLAFEGTAANIYTGTTTVAGGGTLHLDKTGVVAIAGDLAITGIGASVDLRANDQIAATAGNVVTIGTSGTLNLNGFTDSIQDLSMEAGAGVTTLTGQLGIVGQVTTGGGSTSASATIAGNLILIASSRTFTIADTAGVNLDLNVSAAIGQNVAGVGLIKEGAGTLGFTGSAANTYAGTTVVNAGVLLLQKGGTDGAIQGDLTVNSGGIARLAAGNQILAAVGNQVLVDGGQFDLAGFSDTIQDLALTGGSVTTGAGTLTVAGTVSSLSSMVSGTISGNLNLNAGTRTFTVADGGAADDLAISALVSNGGLMKDGPGLLLLSRSAGNGYAGGTIIEDGTLRVSNTSGSATGTNTVVVNSGGTLAGAGIVTGAVSINSGGALAPGAGIGTLLTGALSLNANSTSRFELSLPGVVGGSTNDLVTVNGALTLDGLLVVTELAGFANGTYRLFNYSGSLTNGGLNLEASFLSAHPGSAIDTNTAGQVRLVVVPEPGATFLVSLGATVLFLRRRRAGT